MIDVSAFQGRIHWEQVYKAGVRHAYIKCTEGITLNDQLCRSNVMLARGAGIHVGLYHYAHPTNSPKREWQHFIQAASGLILPGDLPPALDLEVTEGHDWKYLSDWKAQWLHACDDAIGVPHGAVFYSYFYFLKSMSLYPDRPVWGAFYGEPLPDSVKEHWSVWQHSAHGKINGIDGFVDLDTILKDLPEVKSGL
jgi:GH25 family lysozyme M1 (1,4-beta-N-acetylmuramidase)